MMLEFIALFISVVMLGVGAVAGLQYLYKKYYKKWKNTRKKKE